WKKFGRDTYLHDDDADKDYIRGLARVLQSVGWQKHGRKLRTFHHRASQHEIELEPGGSETTGHLLHHMARRATPIPERSCLQAARVPAPRADSCIRCLLDAVAP